MSRLGLTLFLAFALAPAARAGVSRPDDDPFYSAPAGLAEAQPGAVLRTRQIDVTAFGVPLPVDGHQLLYRTADTHGAPETLATVLVPRGEAPAGGRPLLAYQPAEDSLTRDCASSYEIRQGNNPELGTALQPLLSEGAAVVIADYEGPESQWIAGVQAGHAVLDAVRATESFAPAQVAGAKAPVAVWGYSGGAQATAWAAELAPRYAPELRSRPATPVPEVGSDDGRRAPGVIFAARRPRAGRDVPGAARRGALGVGRRRSLAAGLRDRRDPPFARRPHRTGAVRDGQAPVRTRALQRQQGVALRAQGRRAQS